MLADPILSSSPLTVPRSSFSLFLIENTRLAKVLYLKELPPPSQSQFNPCRAAAHFCSQKKYGVENQTEIQYSYNNILVFFCKSLIWGALKRSSSPARELLVFLHSFLQRPSHTMNLL
jgi:hypothetical protein